MREDDGETGGDDAALEQRFRRIDDEVRALFTAYGVEAGEVPPPILDLAQALDEALDRARRAEAPAGAACRKKG
jgi:hypothetical protein